MSGRWADSGGRSLARTNPRLRRRILKRDPICKLQTHCTGAPSVEVDHIIDYADAPELDQDPANLQGVCVPCHQAKTQARAHRRPSRKRTAAPHPGIVHRSTPGGGG